MVRLEVETTGTMRIGCRRETRDLPDAVSCLESDVNRVVYQRTVFHYLFYYFSNLESNLLAVFTLLAPRQRSPKYAISSLEGRRGGNVATKILNIVLFGRSVTLFSVFVVCVWTSGE